jgi:hypothetical protein
MTIETTYVGAYNIDTALSLLSPEDDDLSIERGGCWESLVLLVKKLAIIICRTIHFLCCDWTWYNNSTARQIVELYLDGHERNPILDQKVRNLYQAICLRANGELSYGDGLSIERINEAEAVPDQIPVVPSEEVILDHTLATLSEGQIGAESPAVPASAILRDQKNELQRQIFELLQNLACPSSDYYFCEDLFDFVEKNAFTYPEDAEVIAGYIQDNYFREKMRCVFLEVKARTNLEEALGLINDSSKDTINALFNMIKALEPIHEEQIELLIQKALTQVATLEPSEKVLSLCHFAKVRAQSNEQKAHELCLDALEVTESMTSMDDKLEALAKVAATQVKIHSPAAMSTINKALTLIESCREDKEKKTCDILEALAQIDVDRALEIAHGLENKKGFAIYQVIQAQAKVNPGRAKAILETENFIGWKVDAQLAVVKALVPTHPEEALAIADQMKRKVMQGGSTTHYDDYVDCALYNIVEAIAPENPERALQLARRMEIWSYYPLRAIQEVLKALVQATKEKADPIFQEIHTLYLNSESFFTIKVLGELASAQFRTDPVLSNQIFDEAIALARCASHFCTIAKAQENAFPEKAMANYLHAFNLVKNESPSFDGTEEGSDEDDRKRLLGDHFRHLGEIYNALAERPQPQIVRVSSKRTIFKQGSSFF